MLKTLYIQDYALIEKITIEFGPGLNIITGETGAGKSILIDAMGLLLGERATTETIRKGAQRSVIEGIFDVESNKKVKTALESASIEFTPELILRREVSAKGSSRCFINDSPVTLAFLKETGDYLVDIHGQHEHQSLLRAETHIEMLDDFGSLENSLTKYHSAYQELFRQIHNLNELKQKESILKEKKELYSFQLREIDAVSPEAEEDERIEDELKILENSEHLLESTTEIYDQLYESDNAVYDKLVWIRNKLGELGRIDKSFSEMESESSSAIAIINDISDFIRSYKDKIDLEPSRLEHLRERLSAINMLKRKYGGSLSAVLQHREKIAEEYSLAENFAGSIIALENDINLLRSQCGDLARKISSLRQKAALSIQKDVITALSYLGIPDAVFSVNVRQTKAEGRAENYILVDGVPYKANQAGFDEVEFFISTNIGEDPKPLVRVASGGEVSRIMLALKTILAKNDRLPLLIFDEIDTGVSGRIALKVGQTLKSLASFHQIISITHLPQIAGLADQHYVVEKKVNGDRVTSSIRQLKLEERVHEVAKLMSGEEITEASLKGAKELMGIS